MKAERDFRKRDFRKRHYISKKESNNNGSQYITLGREKLTTSHISLPKIIYCEPLLLFSWLYTGTSSMSGSNIISNSSCLALTHIVLFELSLPSFCPRFLKRVC